VGRGNAELLLSISEVVCPGEGGEGGAEGPGSAAGAAGGGAGAGGGGVRW